MAEANRGMISAMRFIGKPEMVTGLMMLCNRIVSTLGSGLVMYELGSYAGESAEIFSPFFAEVHCVDVWNYSEEGWNPKVIALDIYGPAKGYEVIQSFNDRASRLPNVHKHVAMSLQALSGVSDESLDFVYVDADHSYDACYADISFWWRKVKPGAFIGGHDYGNCDGVIQAVRDFFWPIDGENIEKFEDTSWLVRKPCE